MSSTPYLGQSARAGSAPASPSPEPPDRTGSDQASAEAAEAAPPSPTRRPAPAGNVSERPRRELPVLGGRYALIAELGRGRGRRTFRAHDRVLDRDVVVKVVGAGGATDAGQRAQVLAEARAAGRVVHPNVATVLDVAEEGDVMYMVCELAEGRPLTAVLREHGRLVPAEAVEIAIQIADALAAAHQHDLVHGALTPESIVVTPDRIARLVDLGTVRVEQATRELVRRDGVDRVSSLAPEQLLGEPADPRTDVYALGAILYEMLTGQPPFVGYDLAARMGATPPEPSRRCPSVPPALDQVVLAALAPDPARRYESAAALRDTLRQVGKRSMTDTQVMRRPILAPGDGVSRRHQPSAPRSPAPLLGQPPPAAAPPWGSWIAAGRRHRGAPALPAEPATPFLITPFPRRLLWLGGLLAILALAGLGLVLLDPFNRPSSGEATERWATFARPSCEWSNVTTPPGICFGERPAGYRVGVLEQQGPRWMIWDPSTQGPAYVDGDALKLE